jgi:hypothetical protein
MFNFTKRNNINCSYSLAIVRQKRQFSLHLDSQNYTLLRKSKTPFEYKINYNCIWYKKIKCYFKQQ